MLLGIVIVIVACFALVPESDPEKTAMDEWEVSKCGSEGYVFNVHYNAYGMFYFGTEGRDGWSSESDDPSTFPKWYYYTVEQKNAFGTATIIQTASFWDYQCNLLEDDSQIIGYK